ncbi:magnesium transporter [Weissella uvarum]|uniref:magnesium transporter CorA family protein n=1 Tax=Weissella uvarum TaxID=1479233 RepID=UPI0019601F6D|nr:magnesium transporter CorA family protein [Weissella uvarum]MBM7617044.1 magnesium transporter [Weissella uvarum]MCM0595342.1 magnesium transporter CorA family protein [Weissella uvarum]
MLKELFAGKSVSYYQVDDLKPDEVKSLHISESALRDVSDENEAARWHFSEENQELVMFVDAVVADHDVPSEGAYHTEAVPFIVQFNEHRVLMFARESLEGLVKDITDMLGKLDEQATPTEALLESLLVIYQDYEKVLGKLDNLRRHFQKRFYKKTHGFSGDLDSIATVKNALLYIDASLEDNEGVIKDWTAHFKEVKWTHNLEQLKSRLKIELEQADKMSDIITSVINNISDSYSARNDRNLNWVMQILTVYSVVLTIPTIVTGFYGQNVKYLPLSMSHYSWLITIIITVILMIIATIWFWRHGYFDK